MTETLADYPHLFPFQVIGAQWLAGKSHALLADEMGLGKTVQLIAACDLAKLNTVLVVCPAGLRLNIAREFERFQKIPRATHILDGAYRLPVLKNGDRAVVIVSYNGATQPAQIAQLAFVKFDVVACDEAHYLKSREAARTVAVLGQKTDGAGGLQSKAPRLWLMTGTPMPNNASELWTLARGLKLTAASYWTWLQTFCVQVNTDFGWKIVGLKNAEQLRDGLKPALLRRKKTEVLPDLPPIRFETMPLAIPAKTVSDALGVHQFPPCLDQNDTNAILAWARENMAQTATLRVRIANAKVAALAEILMEELGAKGHKLVVFAHHREPIAALAEALKAFNPVVVTGATSMDERDANVQRFQNDPTCQVFIANIIAAGVGLTLTAASNVVFLETTWVPTDVAQAAMRVHRIGQRDAVLVRIAYLPNSIDEAVSRALRHKSQMIAEIMEHEDAA